MEQANALSPASPRSVSRRITLPRSAATVETRPRFHSNRVTVDKPHIQLVAADLDGTLLDDHKQIDPTTVRAIAAMPQCGVKFVIASARPPRSVRHIYHQLALTTWQINYNGALIWDQPSHHAVFHRPLHGPLVLEMIRLARSIDSRVLVTCEILDRWHTDRFDNTYTTETGRLFKPDVVAPVETYCAGDVTKLLLLGPPDVIQHIEPQLIRQFAAQAAIVRTDANLIQIMHREVNKAVALRRIADHYGVPTERILAIGDAANDLEMIQLAGVGVAVANSPLDLQQHADWVAPTNNDQGVLAALARYVLPANWDPDKA
jgi:5-amino-6-(5-phospho-D-ribitylamino)uracil phosphatase